MRVIYYRPADWKEYSDQAHLICFNELNRSQIEIIDYALMVVDEDKPLSYATLRQLDSETVYLQYGGAFPDTKGTAVSFRCYDETINWLKTKNKYLTTYIENTNTPMLKFAMKVGFRIVGIKTVQNKIYLEHYMEV